MDYSKKNRGPLGALRFGSLQLSNLAISSFEADYRLSLTYRPQRPKLKGKSTISLAALSMPPKVQNTVGYAGYNTQVLLIKIRLTTESNS